MESETTTKTTTRIFSNLGTFEGFNFRTQSAIERILTADEVVSWEHDNDGEAEFWPSGDRAEVALLFRGKNAVSSSELLALDRLLVELGGDSAENLLRIHVALTTCTNHLDELKVEAVEDSLPSIFFGSNFTDLRRETAYELFEAYYPEEYPVWEKSQCDGLIFDTDRFLDSPVWSVEEIELGERKALIVTPN